MRNVTFVLPLSTPPSASLLYALRRCGPDTRYDSIMRLVAMWVTLTRHWPAQVSRYESLDALGAGLTDPIANGEARQPSRARRYSFTLPLLCVEGPGILLFDARLSLRSLMCSLV